MRGCRRILLVVAVFTLFDKGYSQDFGYNEENGPSHWGEKFLGCVGKHQSPIDISERNVNIVKLGALLFENFEETPDSATITNNGHTVMIHIMSENMPTISGGPLKGTYRFAQLHFHWGENDHEGSENTINNSSFPMELHLVFYKTDYGNFSEAMVHSDGLTVLAFLYRISKRSNSHYASIISVLRDVQDPETTTEIPDLKNLDSLLMLNREQYFTYDGSLTTPPCSEVVIWVEFKNPISLSHKQLEEFRSLNNEEGKMTHNFRPTQPIHDRLIFYNPGDDEDIDDNKIEETSNTNTKLQSNNSGTQQNLKNLSILLFNIIVMNFALNYI